MLVPRSGGAETLPEAQVQGVTPTEAQAQAATAFRDSTDAPPPGWTGPVFKLSRDYPRTPPTCAAPWLKRDVSFNDPKPDWEHGWKSYIQDVIDYVKQGQDPDLPDHVGWRVAVGGETRWFHVPWMAYDGERGREFVHGLTNELSTASSAFRDGGRGSGKHQLLGASPQNGIDPLFETWSVGMYNPCGAWSLGQVFPPSGEPATTRQDGRLLAKGLPFPPGTVVIKLLNSTADERLVPYLKGSTNWQVNGHRQTGPASYDTCERAVRRVHLVQIDLAVVDPRSPTRWVYSTLAYDGTLPGSSIWDRLRPLGVQWGSDPGTFPAVPSTASRSLRETILAPIGLPEHYGCERRLAGVVDQANSSCVSCHMGAYGAAPGSLNVQGQNVPAIFNFGDMCTQYNLGNKNYFSNYRYPAPYPSGQFDQAIPLDSSLQVAVAFAQYGVFRNPHNPQAQKVCPSPLAGEAAAIR
ncbi:hypothetical protein mvi_60640 (plasmid) [Methylobacterium indicum]|uniref:Cytochrome c domain-containing protein n=1 Tax=Methylobacterium indicum TaxID=1775910 RepID=A0A8H9C9U4_9HYPH|nr:hypothetical protein mvi_60640 [Methylobacterium indicum]